ncbi:MAG TPA: biotin/lipoyl-containing protein [Thermomicrobiales bacterium]|nr:biotin/lipoyl-containing protein [Thermomicrobiales bacterium]
MRPRADDGDAAGLIVLIDRVEKLLNESELSEIEIEAGSTALVLRKPVAVAPAQAPAAPQAAAQPAASTAPSAPSVSSVQSDATPANAVLAPLTGLFYSSPSPGAQPYVAAGSTITVGQVIGLIEAMKLFNEIKSDRGGRVIRIYPEDGALVKAKQPLIEVEP